MAWGLTGLASLIGAACSGAGDALFLPARGPNALVAQQAGVRVSALFFAGRPDPAYTVTDSATLDQLRSFLTGLPPASPPNWPQLGPRGFLLANLGVSNFPQEVRVFRGVIRIFANGAYQFYQDVHGLEDYLRDQFAQRGVVVPTARRSEGAGALNGGLPLSGSEPPYAPNPWNDADGVQHNNNCYNYACNKMTGTFAQPGRRAGRMYTKFACGNVAVAAIADGLIPWVADRACPGGCYKVALVIAPGVDFHWYRQDANGDWSHKPGETEATNEDESGNAITDPRTADRGMYTDFCGFFCVAADPALVRIR
jgi:hypothetical protein